MSPAKAPEMRDPEYRMAERNANSFLVYQQDRKYRHLESHVSIAIKY